MSDYRPRLVDDEISRMLLHIGAVQIKGPKWCGKTSTARQHAKSSVFLQNPDNGPALLEMASAKPSFLLEGETPRLIDEWQMAPQLWDAVRFIVDERGKPGQFLLTGSTTPTAYGMHSGVGRIAPIVLRTMTLYESGESTGEVSLADLFNGEAECFGLSNIDVEGIAKLICRGGWPAAVTDTSKDLEKNPGYLAKAYVSGLIESDISRVDGISRHPDRMRALMRSFARHVSTQASQATISDDLSADDSQLGAKTVSEYLEVLSRAFVIEDLPAWNPRLRSKTAIRTSPTRHFVDPSIGAAVMNWSPKDLLNDPETLGLQFESLCVRDLRVYAQVNEASVYHYRDKTGLESDMVICRDDGAWALIEVKLGSRQIDTAAANLLKLADRVDTKRMGKPAFLAIITAGTTAYRRDDGVYVIPLACLKP